MRYPFGNLTLENTAKIRSRNEPFVQYMNKVHLGHRKTL